MNQIIRHISFNEKLHKYTDQFNNVYTPVTSQIELYKEPYDREYWSAKKAKELGISQQQVKDSWDSITKIACDKGNVIHKRLETSVENSYNFIKVPNAIHNDDCSDLKGHEVSLEVLRKTPLALHYPKILKLLEFYIEKGWKVYAEKRFYLVEYLIAGTIDLVLIKDKDFIIVDWKTNKDELKFISGYYKKVNNIKTTEWVNKKKYFNFPLNRLEECKGNVYTLQLSSYAYMMEQWGFKCVGLILCHIKETVEQLNKLEEKKVDIMKIAYLKDSVAAMFKQTKIDREVTTTKKNMKFSSKFSW